MASRNIQKVRAREALARAAKEYAACHAHPELAAELAIARRNGSGFVSVHATVGPGANPSHTKGILRVVANGMRMLREGNIKPSISIPSLRHG